MRVCLVHDCLFPYTVGGAERWYRDVGEPLAGDGHRVAYPTPRLWDRGERPEVPGVDVVAVGPRMGRYTENGRRKVLPPLVFGASVLLHLLRRGRGYDVVHTELADAMLRVRDGGHALRLTTSLETVLVAYSRA